MASISDALTLSKAVSELVKKGMTLEAQEKIVELREALNDARDEIADLREQNRELRRKLWSKGRGASAQPRISW